MLLCNLKSSVQPEVECLVILIIFYEWKVTNRDLFPFDYTLFKHRCKTESHNWLNFPLLHFSSVVLNCHANKKILSLASRKWWQNAVKTIIISVRCQPWKIIIEIRFQNHHREQSYYTTVYINFQLISRTLCSQYLMILPASLGF